MLADREIQDKRSHMFIMRIWSEELGDGQQEWRGKVQLSPTGTVQYFRDLRSLGALVEAMLAQAANAPAPTPEVEGPVGDTPG
jgi:hypothetical protein